MGKVRYVWVSVLIAVFWAMNRCSVYCVTNLKHTLQQFEENVIYSNFGKTFRYGYSNIKNRTGQIDTEHRQ